MSKNTNCLKGLRCPECNQEDEILVYASMWVSLKDDGTDPYADSTDNWGGADYDNDSDAGCLGCGFEGKLKEFEI